MFFFFSKTLSYLMKPLVIICVCLVLSWLIRNQRWKKRLILLSTIMLLFFSNEFLLNEAMGLWEVKVTPFAEVHRQYEYGVLLCGVAKTDVGPKDREIKRIIALRDSLFIFKVDGIYRLSGDVAPFTVAPFDFSTQLSAAWP